MYAAVNTKSSATQKLDFLPSRQKYQMKIEQIKRMVNRYLRQMSNLYEL